MKKHVWETYILSILAVLFQFSVTLRDTGMVVDSLDTDH